VAQKIYAQGHGDKGALKWSPVSAVVDALDEAFYATFQNVEPCNKPMLLALDVSGSMAGSMIAGSCLNAREASAAMALITAATETECEIIAFSAPSRGGYGGMHGGGEPGITRVNISARMRLADVIKRIEAIPDGRHRLRVADAVGRSQQVECVGLHHLHGQRNVGGQYPSGPSAVSVSQ
jgi:60 kDa SS-A/Ro ribonucleoprotein